MELPTPAAHGLPDDATIAVPRPTAGLTLHRLLEHEAPSARDFEPGLSRNQAKRAGVPELFRGSISHWLEHEQAVANSERRTSFVARVELGDADSLIRVAIREGLAEPGQFNIREHDESGRVVRVFDPAAADSLPR